MRSSTDSSPISRRSPSKRIDFLTALRDNQPRGRHRPLLAGTRDARLTPGRHPLLRCGVRHALRRRSTDRRAAAEDEGESQAPGAEAGRRAAAGRALRGHRQERERPRAPAPARLRGHARRPRTSCAGRWRGISRRCRSRRLRPHRRGRIDLRRTLRAATRTGELTTLARRDRPQRTRPLLLLIDVSGSLRPNTPDYLRFAWAAQAETFTFGTRLTRDHRASCARATSTWRWRTSRETVAGRRRRHPHRPGAAGVPRHAALRGPGARRADDRALRRARARRPGADGPRGPPARASSPTGCCGGRRSPPTPRTGRSRARWPPSPPTSTAWPAPATSRPFSSRCAGCELRRRASPHLARRGSPLARRADDPAHLRSLRVAAGQAVHGRGVRGRRAAPTGFGQSVYVQANWKLEDSLERGRMGPRAARAHGLAARDRRLRGPVRRGRDRDDRGPARRPRRCCAAPACSCTGTSTRRSASPSGPERGAGPDVQREPAPSCRRSAYVFELQVFPNQLASATAARRRPPRRHVRADPRRHADRGRAVARRADRALAPPERQRQALRSGHVHPPRRPGADRRRHARSCSTRSAPGRAMFGSNFPVESLWTDFSSLVDAWLGVLAEYPDRSAPGRPWPDRAPRLQARRGGGARMTRPVQHTAAAVAGWLREGRRVVAGLLVAGRRLLAAGRRRVSMYVDDQGGIEGSITGGCVEGAVAAAAMEMLDVRRRAAARHLRDLRRAGRHRRADVRRDRPHLHPRAQGRRARRRPAATSTRPSPTPRPRWSR